MGEPVYLTSEDVAVKLRTKAGTVRHWRYVGGGPPSFKLGRRVLYVESEVDAWVAEKRLLQGEAA